MSLINASYFVADLNIPNSDQAEIAEKINWYIAKYEPKCLQAILGYPLYKALINAINAVDDLMTLDQRYKYILFGTEYTGFNGFTKYWKGLITTDDLSFFQTTGGGYKKPQYLIAGTTPGLVAGASSFIFDGTNGTDDWRGWIPVISNEAATLYPDVDYSWNIDTGELILLNDAKFGNNEKLFSEFQINPSSTSQVPQPTQNESVIANYVYFFYQRKSISQSTGIGEAQTNAENAINVSPNEKLIAAWNELARRVIEFIEYMDRTVAQTPNIYPEWNFNYKYEALRHFEFLNSIY